MRRQVRPGCWSWIALLTTVALAPIFTGTYAQEEDYDYGMFIRLTFLWRFYDNKMYFIPAAAHSGSSSSSLSLKKTDVVCL